MFYELQLQWIHFIHQFRTPFLDYFFKALDFFDNPEFFFILIPIIWVTKGWKTGYRLYTIVLLSSIANQLLKSYFQHPRPFHLDPTLGVIQVSGLGFPSGAAQTVILLSGLMLIYWENRWKWIIAGIYITLVSFSRIYLGAHFFNQILAGWIVGGVLVAIYVFAFPLIEKILNKLSPFTLFILSQLIPLLLMYAFYSKSAIHTYTLTMGLGAGIYLAHLFHLKLEPPKTTKSLIIGSCIAVIGTFIGYGLIRLVPFMGSDFLLGLWIAFGISLIQNTTAR